MSDFNDEQKGAIKDVLKTEGWKILHAHFTEKGLDYRRLATQAPEAISDSHRTWYSGKAEAYEELLNGAVDLAE